MTICVLLDSVPTSHPSPQQLTCWGERDGKPFSPQQRLTNLRRLQGKAATLQIHGNNSTIIVLMGRSILFWVHYVLNDTFLTFVTPQCELGSSVWKNLYLSSSSKEQTDGPWAAEMLCSQIKLFYTVHITLDSLALPVGWTEVMMIWLTEHRSANLDSIPGSITEGSGQIAAAAIAFFFQLSNIPCNNDLGLNSTKWL